MIGSNYHIECNPSDVGNSDRFVVQEVIKEIAAHGNIQANAVGSKAFKIGPYETKDVITRHL
jgi:replication factor C subunit 3/5